jgi:hypothetical protein
MLLNEVVQTPAALEHPALNITITKKSDAFLLKRL